MRVLSKTVLPRLGIPAGAVLLAVAVAGPVSAATAPTGIYSGMGTCPLASATMQDPNNGPTATFPDGSSSEIFSTVAPTDGNELSSTPIEVPIPGLADFWPGVTSAFAQVELAGPITDFAPLADGENFPLFKLPIKLHLQNALLGPNCFVGSNSAPIVLEPTSGTTAPPAPNKPISGNPGTIGIQGDPNGFGAAVVGFTGASLVDNSLAVPGANGCGPFGAFDWIVDSIFKLPTAAGHNAVVFSNVNTSLAVDTSISDLSSAISASE